MLARDPALTSRVLDLTLREIFRWYRKRAGGRGRCGAVTFVQRFGGALNLNVHFHCPPRSEGPAASTRIPWAELDCRPANSKRAQGRYAQGGGQMNWTERRLSVLSP
jgi:hypothetical protein